MILETMLERLYANLIHGPSMNCRPHSSRQRVDLALFSRLKSLEPNLILRALLNGEKSFEIASNISSTSVPGKSETLNEEQKQARRNWDDQQKLLTKLKEIAEDALEYEQDTGENALSIGFPLLCLPPTNEAIKEFRSPKLIAPVAFIPVELVIKRGNMQSIILRNKGEGTDLLMPNEALLAWIEQQTGKDTAGLFSDEEGKDPFRELNEVVKYVAEALKLEMPEPIGKELILTPAPRTEEIGSKARFANAAVLGLFPLSNQGLLRDTKAMLKGESLQGPVRNFLQTDVLDAAEVDEVEPVIQKIPRDIASERLVVQADPCQARAVKLARQCPNLVIHGPPGTGKSQTIANIIGDHLAKGERVLLVCDKRTALDVVKNRLDHIGLGQFCAVVHDPQRDQRVLYKSIREQLEGLAAAPKVTSPEKELQRIDQDLQRLHNELTTYHKALSEKHEGKSFHELMGEWLQLQFPEKIETKQIDLSLIPLCEIEGYKTELKEVLQRGAKIDYGSNPWVSCAGIKLGDFLARPLQDFRQLITALVITAQATDKTAIENLPAFDEQADIIEQATAWGKVADELENVFKAADADSLKHWAAVELETIQKARQQYDGLAPQITAFEKGPLDHELALVFKSAPPNLAVVNKKLRAILDYEPIAEKWTRFFAFKNRSEAKEALSELGLSLEMKDVQRAKSFLEGYKARLVLADFRVQTLVGTNSVELPSDDVLGRSLTTHRMIFDLMIRVGTEANLACLMTPVRQAMASPETGPALASLLRAAKARAEAVVEFEKSLEASGLFDDAWRNETRRQLRQGALFHETMTRFSETVDTLEDAIRVRKNLADFPPAFSSATQQLLGQGVDAELGWAVLMKVALTTEIMRRIRETPALQQIDRDRLQSAFQRYRELDAEKRQVVTQHIVHFWQNRQCSRLLAGTQTQLNSQGTKLKQRLFLRGEKAMKLRQMVAHGYDIPDGDPLFDMCPVWMASPGTVAQVFPREPIFDVIIFDEASQCRLEEALPVLTRGKRIVIAGDPKQLPPTRFFETGITESENEEAETDQDLFEQQQSTVEDLLTAALNVEVQQSYLDVHYRSRNEDLIGFSNANFYGSRLQPIPGHPAHRPERAPIQFYRVDGVYENRANAQEAAKVGEIVKQLLAQPKPPSIGIACFNLQQRDLILDTLSDLAEADAAFAEKLEGARKRQGEGSFEGLFVKNLENVQGDERDHMIISTTFGLDPEGKFRRNFGPLGRAAGGRRLNVLVTRARESVHLLTSIPRSEYSALPVLNPDQTPNGRWYLYAYLQYAEQLESQYKKEQERFARAEATAKGTVTIQPTNTASKFTQTLAERLAEQHGASSEVYWGNDGFCVDIALLDPKRPEGVTIGVVCDSTRFAKATDPVEWEAFRTAMLEGQGWKLHRVWTPSFFRDPVRMEKGIVDEAEKSSAGGGQNRKRAEKNSA